MDRIKASIQKACSEIQSNITEQFGAEGEDADETNRIFSNTILEITTTALQNVEQTIQTVLQDNDLALQDNDLANISNKLDIILSEIKKSPTNISRNTNTTNTNEISWGRYQKAFYPWAENEGVLLPKHAGERSKVCSAEYKEFKKKTKQEQIEFLNKWAN